MNEPKEVTFTSMVQIQEMESKEEDFIIGPNLLTTGGAMVVGGETNAGKSFVALHMAQCLVSGEPLFGAIKHKSGVKGEAKFPVQKVGQVLYLDYEVNHLERKKRLPIEISEFGSNLIFADMPQLFRLEEESSSFQRLEFVVDQLRPQVVIFDPFSSTHSYPENTNEVKKALTAIDKLRFKYGVACILVHHASAKQTKDAKGKELVRSPKEMFRGHTSIIDWPDSAIALYPSRIEEPEESMTKVLRVAFAKVRNGRCLNPLFVKIDFDKRRIGECNVSVKE